ncbi:MAG TPA: triose-phosphate isomerase [Chloroflexota bacterium]|nr:triose-phosphate isomerase [Chloroflexota bacterium]
MPGSPRRSFVAGNWKMNTTRGEAVAIAGALSEPLGRLSGIDIAVCPPFVWLAEVGAALGRSSVKLGAQSCHFESKGAFTGEIAPNMLVDVGCTYVIVGHSERRTLFGEGDELVAKKLRAALAHGLIPILCVGENLEQREGGATERVVSAQVTAALEGLSPEQLAQVVIAYEPIWAIGTGRAATAAQANETIAHIRDRVRSLAGEVTAISLRIQYGGSVTPANAADLFSQSDIDGALVGGASLKAPDFITICEAASKTRL